MMLASGPGPSSETVGLIVATYVFCLGSAAGVIGYISRRVMHRFDRNDEDASRMNRKLDRLDDLERRVRVVERGHKKHRKILTRLAWIMDDKTRPGYRPPSRSDTMP